MDKACKNCHWKQKKIGIRGNWCLSDDKLKDVKLNNTCKKFLNQKGGE